MQSTHSEYVTSLSLSVALYTAKKKKKESVLILIRIFIIVSLVKYSKYTVWTWTLHRAYFHVNKNLIITLKYIVPKSEIKTVLYLNVKKTVLEYRLNENVSYLTFKYSNLVFI